VTPPSARSPNDGDNADIRYDSGCHESRLAVVFARIFALDIRRIQENFACDLEVEAALCKEGVVLDWIPRKAIFEVRVYGVLYSSKCVYAIARVSRRCALTRRH
jgi:hypothetical protein